MSATTTDRIRLLLSKGVQPNDAVNGDNPPGFVANTDIQFEIGRLFNGSLIDASDFTQITVAVKPLSNPDAAALMAGTATPSSAGWNSNPVQIAGSPVIPTGATFSAGGSYSVGVQLGASYTWTRGASDLTLTNNGVAVTGSNLIPTGHSYSTGNWTISPALTAGQFYQWLTGANDTGVNSVVPATGFFIATGSDVLNGSGSTSVTAQVYPAVLGSNMVPGISYSGTATATGANMVPGAVNYSGGSYTLTGLTAGATYYWTPGANDTQAPGLYYAGIFVATGTSIVLTGTGSLPVTATVQATTMQYQLNGLVTGSVYYWTKGANDVSCGSLAATGFFTAAASSVVLTGISNAAITAQVQPVSAQTNGTFTAAANTVTITGTASVAVTAGLVGSVGWNSLSDQHCIIPFVNTQTDLAAADGGYTQYALQVSALTSAGTQIMLGYGVINVYDDGYATGTPITGNLIPSGATYDGSGNYSLSGLLAGGTYYWTKNAHDATAPSLSASGSFQAAASTVTLTGTALATVTATVLGVALRPFYIIASLNAGDTGYNAIATLPYSLMCGEATIMTPAGGASIQAPCDFTTLGNVGTTGVLFNFTSAIPAAGYHIKVTLQ